MMRVAFEDCGQGFLEWDLVRGVIVDCRPYQSWLWVGQRVMNTKIQTGSMLCVKRNHVETILIKPPVKSVREVIH